MKLVNPGEEASAPSPGAIRLPHLPTRDTPERERQTLPMPLDDHDSEEQEIEQMFRLKLMDLRRLPRHLRGAALHAARMASRRPQGAAEQTLPRTPRQTSDGAGPATGTEVTAVPEPS